MPNRIIKESIKSNERIDKLTWFEEVVYYRLIVSADDYGCYDGRTILLKNELFPTKDNVTKKAIEDAIQRLVSVGLLRKYEVSGKPYLLLPSWGEHQRIRNKQRKYPAPPDESDLTANCCQLTADCCQTSADCLPESESNPIRIQSQSNPNDSAAPNVAPPVALLPLNTGEDYPITQEQVDEWARLYPAVDIEQQLRSMKGWLDANKTRRKTRNGIERFIVSWLSREQDRGHKPGTTANNPTGTNNVFAQLLQEGKL